MRSRYGWLIALLGVLALVAATAANAGAAPKPPPVADVTITEFDYQCVGSGGTFAVSVSATAVADEDTQLDYMGVGVREYRSVPAGTGDYYPFDTTLDVADWYANLDGWNQDLTNPQSLSLQTDGAFDSHHWNVVLTDGEPDPGSWFMVEAWADGSVIRPGRRGGENRWDSDQTRMFLRCEPYAESASTGSPWEDWNWEEP